MSRHFNTAGPNDPRDHYTVPAAPRLPGRPQAHHPEGLFLLVFHAPRQTGKTTTLRALAQELTAEGRYAALHFSCEAGSIAGEHDDAAAWLVLHAMRRAAGIHLPPELQPPPFPEAPPEQLLVVALSAWTRTCPRPLVLFFDEIDSLQGQSLVSVLRQLREGFPERPENFPWSIVLCGMRDVRDYKAAAGGGPRASARPARST